MDATPQTSADVCFLVRGSDLLVLGGPGAGVSMPTAREVSAAGLTLPANADRIGELAGRSCLTAGLPEETQAPSGMAFMGLRTFFEHASPAESRLASRAVQIAEWARTHRFCGRCGTPTERKPDEGAMRCPSCGMLFFPRISPAVIVLIRDGDRALLARNHRFPPGRYSAVAGFVEPGESLEETVVREVAEEVGVQLKNIRYFGSQPWPFPHSLMIGFTAEYAGGEIRIQEEEIADARWFTRDALPQLPPSYTIARRLIDWFISNPLNLRNPR